MPKSISALGAALFLAVANAIAAPQFTAPVEAGRMAEPKNLEASGVAVSRRTPGLLWTHNDSGGVPVLYGLNVDGTLRGAIELTGVANRDWEDVNAFTLDGRAWLLAAEIGDNAAVHAQCALHVIAEPDAALLSPEKPLTLPPDYTINFVYADGPRDCESVAVDPRERMVYLLSKRDHPARLYRLPLAKAPAEHPAKAEFVGPVWKFPQAQGIERVSPIPQVSLSGWPTSMNFFDDGSAALVLTYGCIYLFPRAEGESWAASLAREPVALPKFSLPQAEGIGLDADGSELFLVSERVPQILRFTRAK